VRIEAREALFRTQKKQQEQRRKNKHVASLERCAKISDENTPIDVTRRRRVSRAFYMLF
jgi:hypothetical protein